MHQTLLNMLSVEGAPEEIKAGFRTILDALYSSYLVGYAVAKRLEVEGDISAEKIYETALYFQKQAFDKVSIVPQGMPLSEAERDAAMSALRGVKPGMFGGRRRK